MRKAYKATLSQGLKGSATVCLVVLDSLHGVVNSANIGDSGYLLMRPPGALGERVLVKYRSPHQEHEFGRPFQLGHHEVRLDHITWTAGHPTSLLLSASKYVGGVYTSASSS
jgi:hypothetical protein